MCKDPGHTGNAQGGPLTPLFQRSISLSSRNFAAYVRSPGPVHRLGRPDLGIVRTVFDLVSNMKFVPSSLSLMTRDKQLLTWNFTIEEAVQYECFR
jgi:hypothetical protein